MILIDKFYFEKPHPLADLDAVRLSSMVGRFLQIRNKWDALLEPGCGKWLMDFRVSILEPEQYVRRHWRKVSFYVTRGNYNLRIEESQGPYVNGYIAPLDKRARHSYIAPVEYAFYASEAGEEKVMETLVALNLAFALCARDG